MPFGKKFNSKNQPTQSNIEFFFNGWIKYITKKEIFKGAIDIDMAICMEATNKYYEDLYRYETISDIKDQNIFKRMAHFTFWIRKLHPLRFIPDQSDIVSVNVAPFINEQFAFILACITIEMETCVKLKLSECFVRDFIFHLRYKSVSPHSLSMLFHALYGKDIVRL